ncbi:MAG: DNA-binding protein WhiA [Lachnospiraceae bacterium]|nr:DNA-binding protein WhiA [Lachnospiraceae bacterium]
MSFAKEVKEELSRHTGSSRHCQLAELAALIAYSGAKLPDGNTEDEPVIELENELTSGKCFTLLVKTFNIFKNADAGQYLSGSKLKLGGPDELRMLSQVLDSDVLIQKSCCMRAYLRGAFLAAGSVSDPDKSYHFEIVCRDAGSAAVIKDILKHFDIKAGEIIRKNHNVVYIKEGAAIVDALGVMEAHVALMDYENARILKEMRNSLNRRVNCETANIGKTVTASVKQTDDIKKVMAMPDYRQLPYGIRQIADLRLKYPDASLKELGEMCDPPIGKSGVNHRLRKLSDIANKG